MSDYIIFAGVNGAGKSTMYRSYRMLGDMKRINSDEILREIDGDWRIDEDQYKAGKIAVSRIKEYLSNNISFNQETTLATRDTIRNAKIARETGYYTEMHYVGVDSADLAIERIAKRVKDGGHGIPEALVRKRYNKSIRNLLEAIKVFETVFVYDNTEMFRPIAQYHNGHEIKLVNNLPDWFRTFLEDVMI